MTTPPSKTGQELGHAARGLAAEHVRAGRLNAHAPQCTGGPSPPRLPVHWILRWPSTLQRCRLQLGEDLSSDLEAERRLAELKSEIEQLSGEKPIQNGFDDPFLRGSSPSCEESMTSLSDRDPAETPYAPFRSSGGSTGERPTKQAANVAESKDAALKLVRGIATTIKRLAGSHESLRYAIADQLVAISDQLRAKEDVVGLDQNTLVSVIRQAGAA